MTVIRPDRGAGTLLGRPIGDKRTLAKVGYLPEAHRFPRYLKGGQVLDYYGALAKVPRSERKQRAGYWLERVGLAEWGSTKVSKYSKGMLQRLGLAQAMMNDPELVFLDEPTDGLDPMGRRDVREMLVEMRGQGKTVFLNSHLLSELEMVCDRAVILDKGRIVRQGTLAELTETKLEVRITTAGPLDTHREELEQKGGTVDGSKVIISGRDDQKVNAMIDLLRAKGVLIQAVEPTRVSLEDVFLEAVGHATPAARPAAPGRHAPPVAPGGVPPTQARTAGKK
jgi:ABC-2 type transport system ATP-binding protein